MEIKTLDTPALLRAAIKIAELEEHQHDKLVVAGFTGARAARDTARRIRKGIEELLAQTPPAGT